jgi:hypothetical protein
MCCKTLQRVSLWLDCKFQQVNYYNTSSTSLPLCLECLYQYHQSLKAVYNFICRVKGFQKIISITGFFYSQTSHLYAPKLVIYLRFEIARTCWGGMQYSSDDPMQNHWIDRWRQYKTWQRRRLHHAVFAFIMEQSLNGAADRFIEKECQIFPIRVLLRK